MSEEKRKVDRLKDMANDAGKGDLPRNNFSESFRDNYEKIAGFTFQPYWLRNSKNKKK
jgi:hypothetical protein